MTPADGDRIKWAHREALCLPVEEREAFLAQIFPQRPELKAEVLDLLHYSDSAAGFLQTPVIERLFGAGAEEPRPLRVGPYELLGELGRGGDASVHLARRADDLFEQQVAVKILNRFHFGHEPFRRFQREIQVLASLQHPYIVRLLDAGTAGEAIAYIVTEYVEGKHIDAYCRHRPLSQIVEVFLKVCEGVSAAHQRLIVHRDLKPSNILVTPAGIPKLVDFGIALPLNLEERLTRTGLGRMTERYASPEQLSGHKEISTLTDVYSLGAVFRELAGIVPRDLDAILAKACSAEPGDRYQAVKQLQEDLERFLAGQPVLARGRSRPYRALRFWRRHWLSVSAVAAGAVALAGLSTLSTMEAVLAKHEAQHIKALLVRGFSETESNPGGWILLPQIRTVESTRLSYLSSLPADLQNDPELQVQRFDSLRTLAAVQGLPSALNLGDTEGAHRNSQAAAAAADALLRRSPNLVHLRDVALVHIEAGTILLEMGRNNDADEQFSRAQAVPGQQNGNDLRTEAEADAQRSRILVLRGQRDEALQLRRRIVAIRRELYRGDPHSMAWEYAGGLCSYGELLRDMARFDEAVRAYAEALPIIEKAALETPYSLELEWHLARENHEYGRTLLAAGKSRQVAPYLDRAIQLYRGIRAREPYAMSNQRALAMCLSALAKIQAQTRNVARSRSLLEESVALSRAAAEGDPASRRAQSELREIVAQQQELARKDGR
jgi:serine/threonine protein kinase